MRVRQLIKDAVEARSELMKIHAALIERNGSKNETVDIGIATDSTEDNLLHADIITRTKDFAVTSPSLSPKLEKPTITQLLPQEVFNQLKAYENEANVWRTKAAQLELLVKEQLMNGATLTELQRYKDECERLKLSLRELECSYKKTMEDSGIEANMSAIGTVEQRSTVDLGDRNQLFTAEITQLNERLKKKDSIIHEFEVTLEELKKKVAVAENKSQEADSIIETMSKKLVERDSEIKVANRSVTKLQDELEKKTKAICYLEERHQVYRNTILDNDLVVSDEATDDWRHGFSDPRYTVNVSRRVQTDLTYEDINKNEYEFISLNEKLKELERDFSKKQSSLRVRFKEIEDILMMKTKLVESLTRQLEDSNKSAIAMDKSRQEERHSFNEKLLKLAKVAERVPVLELEIERLKEEKSALELSLQSAKEEYDHGLEEALSGSLRKFQQQSKYWKQKIAAVHSDNCELKGRILALEKKLEENRLRSKVEKADLAQRLTSSIDHVTVLQNKINTSTCDAQVNVRPQMINKYVACRPNFRDKNTFIMKGELIDETEQQLICCQKELNSAQHQVELLQQELLSKATQLASQNPHVDVGCGTDEQSNTSSEKSESTQVQNASLIGKLKELEKRNTELTAKLEIFEVEKQNLKRLEGKRNAELVVDSKNETRKHKSVRNQM
ncbi:hypothetical protein AB6A40_007222 [Gnathostoma spinigerum]|uniref:Uncharacterized protein n=1 Tax=Gnathostoma spinigerum TaxID=75299 RepID=A0ABD6EKL1_9BILA